MGGGDRGCSCAALWVAGLPGSVRVGKCGVWRAVPTIFATSGIWSRAVPGTLYTGSVQEALYCVVRAFVGRMA